MPLRVVGDLDVGAELNAALERRQFADQCAQRRRLAGAVGTEQRHAVAALDGQFAGAHQHVLAVASRRLRPDTSRTAVTVGKTRVRCHTVDLSANGARLKPRGNFQPGTPIELQFQPPDGPMMEVAAVVWRVESDSMAVMFLRNIAAQVAAPTRMAEHGRRGWR